MKYTQERKAKLVSEVNSLHDGGMSFADAFKKVGIAANQFYTWNKSRKTTVTRTARRPAILSNTRQPLVLILGDADEISEVLNRYSNR